MVNTLDPIVKNTHLRDDNYFYYMPLMLKYTPANAPAYLRPEYFALLREDSTRLDAIKIHTKTIIEVLNQECDDQELTKVILMDHLDWFSVEDATAEIQACFKKMAVGGKVFWRSAGKYPWYNELFEANGFRVEPCQIREGDVMYIDRVNSWVFCFFVLFFVCFCFCLFCFVLFVFVFWFVVFFLGASALEML